MDNAQQYCGVIHQEGQHLNLVNRFTANSDSLKCSMHHCQSHQAVLSCLYVHKHLSPRDVTKLQKTFIVAC
jgi:hypothetical protein